MMNNIERKTKQKEEKNCCNRIIVWLAFLSQAHRVHSGLEIRMDMFVVTIVIRDRYSS